MVQITESLKSSLFNIPGWHTNRKIIVFESDDWGSIRIPSRETYDYLISKGYALEKTPYSKDCLENEGDISGIMDVLSKHRNRHGVNPVFTLNYIVANPDFGKIKRGNFQNYYYELFTETYKSYFGHAKNIALIKDGINRNIFKPQLHGREHLNIKRWLDSLSQGQTETVELFNKNMFGLPQYLSRDDRRCFQRAFDYDNVENQKDGCKIIYEACDIFKKIWGYSTISFIAPNFFWDDYIEKCLFEKGVMFLQGQRAQFLTDYNGSYKAKYHFTGQKNKLGQRYIVRNCHFEPSFGFDKDCVDSCLSEINLAFKMKKPAVIGTHRVNYIGNIDITNRKRGLEKLSALLSGVLMKWPGVEFMSTDQLGKLIISKSFYS